MSIDMLEVVMPNFWEQMFGFIVIALSMVFGGYLYRKRHGGVSKPSSGAGASSMKRPRKKR